MWERMASIYPQYQRFATRTSREIPVVIIEPATGAP
ncbi:MAG: nitroreductase family deazaflavin-dependent oxidoreductase, partial [Pseudonocardiales bacterium]|nr:nitroreductase family deazaflavin-dependent oxidoreductase [Pseudonocardiales bacterium]